MGYSEEARKGKGMVDGHENDLQTVAGGLLRVTRDVKLNSQAGSRHTKLKRLALIMALERHLPFYVSLYRSCRPVRLHG